MQVWQIGDVRVTRIEEFIWSADPPSRFFPDFDPEEFARHADWLAPHHYDAARDQIRFSIHSWLVETPRHRILIDACGGNGKERPGMPDFHLQDRPFLQRLAAAGVTPDMIDVVMCTHLHVDHIGWNTQAKDGRWVPTFPNATYVMSRIDHDLWHARAGAPDASEFRRQAYADSILPVMESGRVAMVEDGHECDAALRVVAAPGHTPGHFRIDLASADKRAVFAGDALHSPLQVPLWQWSASSCEDPVQSRATRHALLGHCAETRSLMLPAHFGAPHAAYIRGRGEAFELDWAPPG
ncbi:MBL fold metallo-hydrolase [Desertibaculum subflavum]|uniref:MBL fold metallo-hydrolase n=1 Tax=Desertibaculum subflavum TaxID=2268458 RepID=UPI000E668918